MQYGYESTMMPKVKQFIDKGCIVDNFIIG